jgi:iron complex outermembrane recepter protein
MPLALHASIAALVGVLSMAQPGPEQQVPRADDPHAHAAIASLFLDGPADSTGSGSAPTWTDVLDTTVVRAPRPTRRDLLLRMPGFTTLIDIAAERGPAEGAGDLLERTVGASVLRRGGPGAMATLSIRGIDPGHVEVFLDRVPLRTASQGTVDLNTLDLAHFEAIEVYRSLPPPELGGETAGAAIRLVPRSVGGTRVGLHASGGSFGTRSLATSASLAHHGTSGLVSFARFETNGDFRYLNDNGTEQETADDRWETWTNGNVRRDDLLARVSQALGHGLKLDVASQLSRSEQGVPGTGHQPTQRTRLETTGALHRASLELDTGGQHPVRAEIYGHLSSEERRYRDPDRELAVTGTATRVDQQQDRFGVGAHASWVWWGPGWTGTHEPELLWEGHEENLRNLPLPGRPQEDRRHRRGNLLSLGDRWNPWRGRLTLEAHYRWEQARNNYTGANPWRPFSPQPEQTTSHEGPRYGARCDIGRGWSLEGTFARYARFPTFVELFGYAGTIQGNPKLEPERGQRWDAGCAWQCGSRPAGMQMSAEASYYTSSVEQMIVLITISDRETKPANLDAARIRGAELSLTVDHLPLLCDLRLPGVTRGDAALTGHITWEDARDEGRSPVYHGKQLTYHPPWRAALQLAWTQGPFSARHEARYQDGAYWGRSNLPEFRSPGFWNHDLSLRWEVRAQLIALAVRVENLLDERHEDIRGYPLPGRSWFGGIDVAL